MPQYLPRLSAATTATTLPGDFVTRNHIHPPAMVVQSSAVMISATVLTSHRQTRTRNNINGLLHRPASSAVVACSVYVRARGTVASI